MGTWSGHLEWAPGVGTWSGPGQLPGQSQHASQRSGPHSICRLHEHQEWLLFLHSEAVPGPSWLLPHSCALSSARAALALAGSCIREQEGPRHALGRSWETAHGKPVSILGSFIRLLPPPCFRRKQVCACSSGAESKFLAAPLLFQLVFKQANGYQLPCTGHQGRGTQYVVQTTHSSGRISQPM